MLDFTSALYLGFGHASASLRPWARLTTGVPAWLRTPPGAAEVEEALAALQGCRRALLFPSTLHLFWDLFDVLSSMPVEIHLDAGAYPIVKWGVERAAARGVPVRSFEHHDVEALLRAVERPLRRGARPLVVTDGLCMSCGSVAPLSRYLAAVEPRGGLLIADDTQPLGLLGASPSRRAPHGEGGGGSLRYHALSSPSVVLGSSLAKGFGVPVAALSGGEPWIQLVEERSATRMHTSPPSAALIHAAEHALRENEERGVELRRRLWSNIAHFRRRVFEAGLHSAGGSLPVQAVAPPAGMTAPALQTRLASSGVRTFLQRSRCGGGVRVGFVITAIHGEDEIDHAAEILSRAAEDAAATDWRVSISP